MAVVKSDWEIGDEYAHTDANQHAAQTNANTEAIENFNATISSELDAVGVEGDTKVVFRWDGEAISDPFPIPGAVWDNVADKPDVIGAGATQLEARTAIDATAPEDVSPIAGFRTQDEPEHSGRGINVIGGDYDNNLVATDLGSCTIGGGGQPGYNNVCGGDGSATVDTPTPNTAQTGTDANYSIIPGGYDNVAGGLASAITGWHNYTAIGTTHGTIAGGSKQKITKPGATNNYSTIGGGSSNEASGTGTTIAGGSFNVASGSGAVIGGGNTQTASGVASTVCGGQNNVASGTASTIPGGRENTASGYSSTAIGRDVLADQYGELTQSSGMFAAQGDAEVRRYVVRNSTTDETVTSLWSDGVGARPRVPEQSTWFVTVKIVGRRTDADDESASYHIEGCMDRNTGDTAAMVGTITKTVVAEDTAGWDATVSVNASGTVNINVTGEAAKTIQWVAMVEAVQVTG